MVIQNRMILHTITLTGQKKSKGVPNFLIQLIILVRDVKKNEDLFLIIGQSCTLNAHSEIQILDGFYWLYPCKWDKNACRLSALHVCSKYVILYRESHDCWLVESLKVGAPALPINGLRERPLLMSNFRRGWGVWNDPKNWTLEGKNRMLGGNNITM